MFPNRFVSFTLSVSFIAEMTRPGLTTTPTCEALFDGPQNARSPGFASDTGIHLLRVLRHCSALPCEMSTPTRRRQTETSPEQSKQPSRSRMGEQYAPPRCSRIH